MIRLTAAVLCPLLLTTSCVAVPARALQAIPSLTSAWSRSTPLPNQSPTGTSTPSVAPSSTLTPSPTAPSTAMPSLTPTATSTPSPSPVATVDSLRATVTADLLSCRYGPGPEYLFLYALRGGVNIKLIGRVDGDNWRWAWVEGRTMCWVNTRYIHIDGDWQQLPVVYPGIARLPISPYYPPTSILSAVRGGRSVTIEWLDIPLRAGDEEDQYMQHYIIETWRCQGGRILFEPLATNYPFITFVDEPGCSQPSHGRLFVQEKHGFAGPTEVSWPVFK